MRRRARPRPPRAPEVPRRWSNSWCDCHEYQGCQEDRERHDGCGLSRLGSGPDGLRRHKGADAHPTPGLQGRPLSRTRCGVQPAQHPQQTGHEHPEAVEHGPDAASLTCLIGHTRSSHATDPDARIRRNSAGLGWQSGLMQDRIMYVELKTGSGCCTCRERVHASIVLPRAPNHPNEEWRIGVIHRWARPALTALVSLCFERLSLTPRLGTVTRSACG